MERLTKIKGGLTNISRKVAIFASIKPKQLIRTSRCTGNRTNLWQNMKSRTEWENSSNSLSDSKIKILSFASIFLWYLLLLFSDITAIFPQIDISVCIDLDVFPIAGQQQIQDMKSIKLSNPTPTATAIWTTLQLFVIIRIDPVYERSNSYLIRHN